MVLGTLSAHGPTHGHQIRRLAEVSNVGEWGGVSVGALYRELRIMEGEGLVEPVRTERVGRRPARTVYRITDAGGLELATLRERAIKSMITGPDPLGVALTFAFEGADRDEMRDALRARRNRLAISAQELRTERERLLAKGYIGPAAAAVMQRGVMHLETEIRWHDELGNACGAPEDGANDA